VSANDRNGRGFPTNSEHDGISAQCCRMPGLDVI
jgi:hypothetical protein